MLMQRARTRKRRTSLKDGLESFPSRASVPMHDDRAVFGGDDGLDAEGEVGIEADEFAAAISFLS